MEIGILLTGHVPEDLAGQVGNYSAMFARLLDGHGFTFRTWAVVDMEFPAAVTDADGWLITGSRHGAYDDLPFISRLSDFIRDAYARAVPMAGICFGHQVMAQALGGKVVKYPGGWAVGAKPYDFDGETLMLNAWHQDQVVEIPPGATVIARNDFCAYAGLAYGDRAYSIQPHPEIRPDYLQGLIRTRGPGVVPEAELQGALDHLDAPLDDHAAATRIAEFFLRPRAQQPKA